MRLGPYAGQAAFGGAVLVKKKLPQRSLTLTLVGVMLIRRSHVQLAQDTCYAHDT